MTRHHPLAAFAVAILAIGALSAMDAVMKGLAQNIGAFATMCWRSLLCASLAAALYLPTRKAWPSRAVFRVHLTRGAIMVPMSLFFFWGLARVPMAQAIALTFIAPLLALYLAAAMLGEAIGRTTLVGSLLAFLGVLLIFVGQAQADLGRDALLGSLAILVSAVIYAFNIVLMRRQALGAGPVEIAFFQFVVGAFGFWLAALFVGAPVPPTGQWLPLAGATLLAMAGMMLLAVAYARAGAAYLSTSEYTGFIWAAIFGFLFFAETPSPWTVAGAVLIVCGCWIAARTTEHPALETSA